MSSKDSNAYDIINQNQDQEWKEERFKERLLGGKAMGEAKMNQLWDKHYWYCPNNLPC